VFKKNISNKNYNTLKTKLLHIFKNLKFISMIGIEYNNNNFVTYKEKDSDEKKKDSIKQPKYTIRSIYEKIMNTLLDTSHSSKISEFQKLMKEKLNRELLYIVITNDRDNLLLALEGKYQKQGGRKTKKITNNNKNKTNIMKHLKKTRSIKRSKKNKTRRR
jgi:hypothetical protein